MWKAVNPALELGPFQNVFCDYGCVAQSIDGLRPCRLAALTPSQCLDLKVLEMIREFCNDSNDMSRPHSGFE